MSVVKWRATKFFAKLVRCKVRGIAKIPVQRDSGSNQSKILPRCQISPTAHFRPCGDLVGECLPQTLLRPRGLQFLRFRLTAKAHTFRRSSSPHTTRFAGLVRGPQVKCRKFSSRPVWQFCHLRCCREQKKI